MPHHVGTAERQCGQRLVAVPRLFAKLLGLDAGATMVERIITLVVDDEPILTSTSYLPVDLADDDQRWHAVDIGQLAVIGHAVTFEFTDWSRTPTRTECDALNITRNVPLVVLSRPYQVLVDHRTLSAGVIVRARGDRVLLHWGRDYQGLVLRAPRAASDEREAEVRGGYG